MTTKITIKDIVEYFFDKAKPVMLVHNRATNRNYRNRTIESYNYDTGEFKISGCRERFNIHSPNTVIEFEHRDSAWSDFICRRILCKDFDEVQNIVYNRRHDSKSVCELLGGRHMKYTSSHPETIDLYLDAVKVYGVKTYRTVTDMEIDGWCVGHTYSNTSTRWAFRAGFGHKVYSFGAGIDD